MDAHLFRRYCDALIPRIMGARMEKIHALDAHVTVFTIYGGHSRDGKRYLTLRADRKSPLLFSSSYRVPVNAQPPASVMRLRKHLSGRRIVRAFCEWGQRRLWLEFAGENPLWLCLDLREGPSLSFDEPVLETEQVWPQDEDIFPEADRWKDWPVLTPSLRRTLSLLSFQDAQALLVDLQAGGGDVFFYENSQGRCEVSAWPLPKARLEALGGRWTETVLEDPLEALSVAGEKMVYAALAAQSRQTAAKPFSHEVSRLEKLLLKLEGEQKRLSAMSGKRETALLLQSQLYLFAPEEKVASVTLDINGVPQTIPLDARLTVRENMTEMFRQAGRGKRGLEHLLRRRREVLEQKKKAEISMQRMLASVAGVGPLSLPKEPPAPAMPKASFPGLPKQVQAFRSSDGFVMLRGRDTRGNALVLKLASPYDYWLHTADGPSAHVVIRRDHAGQEIPARTMDEAGILVALKSWQKDQQDAMIQYSLAKHIRPMKNAAPGMVRIDRSEGAFRVRLEHDLEDRLEKS